ncbi:MAG: CDP-glycerol glycerophosphotransferase family protein [Lachnospiraceae bacterium]|nr:CDP-glycerol glycerophosphotransferase family protein [Lachnospiraceae bacterium]MDY4969579.1 CDP-glycerol glycerophosphotransferase family protein [Lachnospiraceae bacterium]
MSNKELLNETLLSLEKVKPLSNKQKKAVEELFTIVASDTISDDDIHGVADCIQTVLDMQPGEKNYNTILKRICIKNLIPAVYTMYRDLPVENKYLFMQPRSGLNQSCRFIYKKIEKNYDCILKLHELKRGTVSTVEYYANALLFVKDLATAKAVFVHESNDLLGYVYIRPETKVIQLWHGCGVLKKLGYSTVGKKGFKSGASREEFPEYNKYSIVTISSPADIWIFEEFMGLEKKSGIIQPIGISRTDEFFDQNYIENCYKKLYKAIPEAKNKKLILYAPTYRGVDPNRVTPNELDIEKFAEALGDDYLLIFKHHQTAKNLPVIPEKYRDKFAYDMTRGRGMDINELMVVSDICITDYSSVAFEFSLFERPLLFYVFDLEEYMDDRGLYYDFNEITPGPLCRTNEEMIDYIRHIDERFDKQEIIDFKNKFMSSCDGHATERILDYVGIGKDEEARLQRNEKYQVYYFGKNAGKQEYHSAVSQGEVNGIVSVTKSGGFEFRDQNEYSTEQPCRALLANRFKRTGYEFAGWYMRKTKRSSQYWYCEDGTWRMNSEMDCIPHTSRHLFHEGDSLEQIRIQEAESILVMETQWTPKKFMKIYLKLENLLLKVRRFLGKGWCKLKKKMKKILKK